MADDLQPDVEGQGDAGSGIFDPYLQAVPEDARDTVASYLKDAEKNVNGRLAQAAELEKSFGAYKDVDLSDTDPESLNQLLAWWRQVGSDDGAFEAWMRQEAEAKGLDLTAKEADELESAVDSGELTREEVQQLIQQAADERLAPIQEQVSAFEAEKAVGIEENAINEAFQSIQSEHGLDLTKDMKAVILDLGMPLAVDAKGQELPMGDASWVLKGFDRWKEITDSGNRTFVEQKASQPGASLTAGGTPALKPITSFEDANAAMRERLRSSNQ
jgi:hypothetical protein